jgi:hypothetical protein
MTTPSDRVSCRELLKQCFGFLSRVEPFGEPAMGGCYMAVLSRGVHKQPRRPAATRFSNFSWLSVTAPLLYEKLPGRSCQGSDT